MNLDSRSPVAGRRFYRKELIFSPTSSTNQHEQSPGQAEISSDESGNEEFGSASQEENATYSENDDSLEDGVIIKITFPSVGSEPLILECANIKKREPSAGASHKGREPSASLYPTSPRSRRVVSVQNTSLNRSKRGGPHEDCVGKSPLGFWNIFTWPLLIILAVFAVKCVPSSDNATNRCETLEKLKETLPEIVFKNINKSVTGTLFRDSSTPTVLMFLQKDLEYANKTVDKIANSITDCFDFDAKKETLDPNYFKSIYHPNSAVEHVKAELSEGGVLVVPNLQEVRGDVALAFQSICDLDPVLVKKLIVLFTLTPHVQEDISENRPTKIAEDTLNSLWKDLVYNELQPLVTRVTDQVVWLHPK